MSTQQPTRPASVKQIAPGVSLVRVGAPFRSHVYVIDAPDGPIAFDAGIKGTGAEILAAAGGRVERVILSHSHVDHRGGAPELGAPIYCHPDEVADAEGDGGRRYSDLSLIRNEQVREMLPALHDAFDGGPVSIAGTVTDGEQIAGFRVMHIPGHAPGQIALFRESDRSCSRPTPFTRWTSRGEGERAPESPTRSATGTRNSRASRSAG